jgi:hypothetical protein
LGPRKDDTVNRLPLRVVAASLLAAGAILVSLTGAHAMYTEIYGALGDGVASGEGNPPYSADGGACDRSDAAYPVRVAFENVDLVKDLAACAGATVSAVGSSQTASVASTFRYISLSVGASDVGLWSQLATCRTTAGCDVADHSALDGQLAALPAALSDLLAQVRTRAPQSTIIVLGYPNFTATSPRSKCLPGLGLDNAEASWLNGVVARLNSAIASAVTSSGIRASGRGGDILDPRATFAGHEACGGSTAWLGSSFYPNSAGHDALASLVKTTMPLNGCGDGSTTTSAPPTTVGPKAAAATKPPRSTTTSSPSSTSVASTSTTSECSTTTVPVTATTRLPPSSTWKPPTTPPPSTSTTAPG